jgi:hypothetical protein
MGVMLTGTREMKSMMIRTLILTALLLVPLNRARGQNREMGRTVIQGDTMFTLGPPGMIPAIDRPEFTRVDSARGHFAADEPLLVVAVGEDVHAYSTWHLDHHEVVNDRLGDVPLAATW